MVSPPDHPQPLSSVRLQAPSIHLVPLLAAITSTLLLAACASKGDEMRTVVPTKTTYLSADGLDGGAVDRPPRVVEEVRPSVPPGVGAPGERPTAVLRFVIDASGRIREIEVLRADDDRLAAPAAEAISRWRIEPARRDGQPIPAVATVQLTFDTLGER